MDNQTNDKVSYCGLTKEEYEERNSLLEKQSNHLRWFSRRESSRLNELSNKMFEHTKNNKV